MCKVLDPTVEWSLKSDLSTWTAYDEGRVSVEEDKLCASIVSIHPVDLIDATLDYALAAGHSDDVTTTESRACESKYEAEVHEDPRGPCIVEVVRYGADFVMTGCADRSEE